MSTTAQPKKQCAAKTKKPGNPLCTTAATIKFEGCDYCKQHAKMEGWIDTIPAVATPPPKAAPATTTKKTVAKVGATKVVEKVAEATVEASNVVVKPGEGKHGQCTTFKTGGKERCGNPGKFKCEDECTYCGGEAKCGMHWNSAHKTATLSGGKTTSTRKEVPDDKKCSHNKKSGDKGPCGKAAYGVDNDGNKACVTHGGPKKADSGVAGSTSGGSKASAAGGGVFAGLNWPRVSELLANFMRDFYSSGEDEATADSEAMNWLLVLIGMFKEGQPESEKLLVHFAKSGWTSQKTEFSETYKHSMLFVLRKLMNEEDTNWLVRMYGNLSKEAGDVAAEVAAIWIAAAKECGISLAQASATTSGTGSSTKGAAVVTSNRKATTQALIKKAQAAAANKSDKGKEEADDTAAEVQEEVKADDEVQEEVEDIVMDDEDDDGLSVDSDGNIVGMQMEEVDEDYVPAEEGDVLEGMVMEDDEEFVPAEEDGLEEE